MSVSSEDSLIELPLPFDISSAVSRALRISSSSGSGTNIPGHNNTVHREVYPVNASQGRVLTGFDGPSVEIRTGHEVCYTSDYCCPDSNQFSSLSNHYPIPRPPLPPGYSHNHHPRMDLPVPLYDNMSGSNSTISVCTNEEFTNSPTSTEHLEQFYDYIDNRNQPHTRIQSYSTFYPTDSPPRKRRRNTVQCCDDDECYSPLQTTQDSFSDWPWKVELDNSSLWRNFDGIGTEMVVTKGGRRMFPHLELDFQDFDPHAIYSIRLEIIPCDSKRYKFLKTEWVPTGRAEKKQIQSEYEHPESPNTGSFWMSKPVTFKMVKLTNNKSTKFRDQIILNSMQKYKPCVLVTDEKLGETRSFCFPETTFIAVTAYQNNLMTQMKIDHNPYARAFREGAQTGLFPEKKGGHYDRFRKSSSSSPSHKKDKERKQSSPPSSPGNSNSATSVDSGCGSSGGCSRSTMPSVETSPLLVGDKTIIKSTPFTSSSLSYWADDNSLWNPNLITPDPLMDSTSSFSEPYLQQTAQLALDYNVSPVKGLSLLEIDDCYPQTSHSTYLIDSVNDDDDVFL